MRKPTVQIMKISPTMAENWLTNVHPRNRKFRPRKVAQYKADMEAGKWLLSDQAISFDTNNELVNGRHRLLAGMKSGVTFESVVMFGLHPKTILVLDGGLKRSTEDNFTMAGFKYPNHCGSTVRAVMSAYRLGCRSFTDQEVAEFMEKYAKAVAVAHSILPNGQFGKAMMRAVLTRAKIRREPEERLREFGKCLYTGFMEKGDEAAILLRNKIIAQRDFSNRIGRMDILGYTEHALQSFLDREKIKKLIPISDEIFPIPGEQSFEGAIMDDEPATVPAPAEVAEELLQTV